MTVTITFDGTCDFDDPHYGFDALPIVSRNLDLMGQHSIPKWTAPGPEPKWRANPFSIQPVD